MPPANERRIPVDLGPLADFADWYDGVVNDSYEMADYYYYDYNRQVGAKFGAGDRRTKNFLILTTTLYGLYMGIQSVTQGMIDTLRIGRGVSKGTLGGVAEDGLRLLSFAGGGAKALVKYVPEVAGVAAAGKGGVMSCGPTSIVMAARLTATELTLSMDRVRRLMKLPL
jgi:hypothetical protein